MKRFIFPWFFVVSALLRAITVQAQSNYEPYAITTLAGSAGQVGSADGTGSAARFSAPFGVAVSDSGNLYVAGSRNHTMRAGVPAAAPTSCCTVRDFGDSGGPYSVAVGDFNGDSKQDLAVANFNSDNVSILLGDGAGSFSAATNFGASGGSIKVAVGDFNGDGKQDLAVANYRSGNVSILLGDGAGSFSAATNFGAGIQPVSVAVGDFNGDGKQDLAVANRSSGNVSILLGDGAGHFSAATNLSVGTYPLSVAVGDFNGDGKQDLAVANDLSSNVSILLGDGTGSFSAATYFAAGADPYSVALGDFNGDGKQDLAAANYGSGYVSILLGNGAGSFSAATYFGAGTNPISVAVGDFNGDGTLDLAAANYGSGYVSILLGNGAGSFSAATNFGVGTEPVSVAVGDFNRDGKQDLAVANYGSNTVSILLRYSAATPPLPDSAPPVQNLPRVDHFYGDLGDTLNLHGDEFSPNSLSFLMTTSNSTAPLINPSSNHYLKNFTVNWSQSLGQVSDTMGTAAIIANGGTSAGQITDIMIGQWMMFVISNLPPDQRNDVDAIWAAVSAMEDSVAFLETGNYVSFSLAINAYFFGHVLRPAVDLFAQDPPDPNYQTVYEPHVTYPSVLPSTGNAGLDLSIKRQTYAVEAQSAYLQAVNASFDKYAGAIQANDNIYAALQMEALLKYLKLYNESAQESVSAIKATQQSLTSLGLAGGTYQPTQLSAIQNDVAKNGLPSDTQSLLETIGLSTAQIDQVKQSLLALNPNSYSGRLEDANNLASATISQASTPLAVAVTRKTHGAAGNFDITLPLTGPAGIECRSGGGNGDYQVVVAFPNLVTFNNASLTSGDGTVAGVDGSGTDDCDREFDRRNDWANNLSKTRRRK